MNAGVERAPFDQARRFAWLKLWRSENIGPRTFEGLLSRFGSVEAALERLPDLLKRANPGRPIRIADDADITQEFEDAARLGARFICKPEPDFPALLREIPDPPSVICVRGHMPVLQRPAVAIVGARNASAAGLAFAERLARGLAQAGYVIVSGFARGIDSRAHRASLATGTVAVLAGGHGRLYPADQTPFMNQILEEGAAVSEMPLAWEARGRDFPRRNRLISGLALGVVVVEAAHRSGSLITARFAADQGREVFAVPGSPLDPRAEGTNDLIRDGATFCTDVEDVVRALTDRSPTAGTRDLFADAPPPEVSPLWDELDLDGTSGQRLEEEEAKPSTGSNFVFRERPEPPDLAPVAQVRTKLGPAPISIDELARAADLPIRVVRRAVLELEIAGQIERHGGGLISLIMA